MPRLALLPPLLMAVFLVGCGSSTAPADAASQALAKGDFERAALLLEDLEGRAADRLRDQLQERIARREKELERIDKVLEGIDEKKRITIQNQLLELRKTFKDNVAKKRIDHELSGLADRYAALKGQRVKKKPGSPEAASRVANAAPSAYEAYEVAEPERAVREDPIWDPYKDEAAPSAPLAKAAQPESEDPPLEVDVAPPGDGASADTWAQRAYDRLRDGDLVAARKAYLEAASSAMFGVERRLYAGLAREVEDRRLLREELIAAFAVDGARFESAGIQDVRADVVIVGGEERTWIEVDIDLFLALGGEVPLSLRARLGLLHERLLRYDVLGAWESLAELEKEGLVSVDDVAGIVSRFRGEVAPVGGYVFHKKDWIAREEIDEKARKARVADLSTKFGKARAEQRDELVQAMLAEGADEDLRRVVQARWAATAEELADDLTIKRLAKLGERRAELDTAREEALALIFDEEEYFYPYRPPECPSEKAALYPAVQRRVDELVTAVRRIWGEPGNGVVLSKEFRDLVEEITWSLNLEEQLEVELDRGLLPAFFDGIDFQLERITLHDFAWDAEERQRLAYDRAVLAYNRQRFESAEWPAEVPESEPGSGEQTQVKITNAYRRQMGRRALAWNPLIQAAAQDHSDYMSRTGDFGHFEPDPERKRPGDRMRRRGYTMGMSENCAMSGGAESAHVGWLHSSGHHRNILLQGHREMASALAGPYWTQNFGTARDFEAELRGWRD